jgi:HSP20 family protein
MEDTMVDRYNGWARPLAMHHMMNRLLRDAFVSGPAEHQHQQPGAMEVYEEGDNLVVNVQMPGVKPEDIEVTLQHGILTVRGQIKSEGDRKDRSYVVREHRTGSFVRQLRVSESLDAGDVKATFEHGVLRLTLPKQNQPGAHRIPVTTGTAAAIESAPATESAPASERGAAPVEASASPAAETAPQPEATASDDTSATDVSGSSEPTGDTAPKSKSTRRKPASRNSRSREAAASPA